MTSRPSFSSFFSFDAILRQLVKWRVRAMARRREDAFYAAHLQDQPQPEEVVACDAAKYLPPRNLWKRPKAIVRKHRSAEEIASESILRTVYGFRKSGRLASTSWGQQLERLVDRVRVRMADERFAFDPPRLLLKPKDAESYRALASYENIEDRLILGGVSQYLRGRFDPFLSPHCHSFRVHREISHQSAVAELIAYRQKHLGETLYVAECDIMKFFDVVDHREAMKAFDTFAEKCGGLDARVRTLVAAYAASYSFEGAMERAKNIAAARGRALPLDRVGRAPKDVLAALHPGEDVSALRLGLPQGGALSPLFANILLAEADKAVVGGESDPDLLYIRFCDDMIIVHTDRAQCEAAMKRYLDAVRRRKLPVHPAGEDGFAYGTEYYEAKTKAPFEWRQAKVGERNAAPWVSFLGYQINSKGEARVRQETIRKHLLSLKSERVRFERRVAGSGKGDDHSQLERHFKAHLIAKGIGFIKAGAIRGDSLCWAAAFPNLKNVASRACTLQMRTIDAVRDRMMRFSPKDADRPHPFFGRPFSYLGYLMRKPRPERHRRTVMSTCSDFRMYGLI